MCQHEVTLADSPWLSGSLLPGRSHVHLLPCEVTADQIEGSPLAPMRLSKNAPSLIVYQGPAVPPTTLHVQKSKLVRVTDFLTLCISVFLAKCSLVLEPSVAPHGLCGPVQTSALCVFPTCKPELSSLAATLSQPAVLSGDLPPSSLRLL